ncbi:MAG TPA: methyltransferase, TIGR04325 family [Rhodocyclaceae bacterium]|jgi:putative methyltransferase (TIGR04325 family)
MRLKDIARTVTPPLIWNGLRRFRQRDRGWFGDYPDWAHALEHEEGYATDEILERMKDVHLRLQSGELSEKPDPNLLGYLLLATTILKPMRVMDFGGSLGRQYFRVRNLLDLGCHYTWGIVEQDNFVQYGNQFFANEQLRFYGDAATCMAAELPNVLLASNALQYFSDPYAQLDILLGGGIDYVIVHDLPVSLTGKERITIQRVDPNIYKATLACRLFSEANLLTYFTERGFRLLHSYRTAMHDVCDFRGYVFKRRCDAV